MSQQGKDEARRLLRLWAIAQRVKEEGRHLITVGVGPAPDAPLGTPLLNYEQYVAVRVDFACGYRETVWPYKAHGGCGRRWSDVKLEGDPDPPHDADANGVHDRCALFHRLGCVECAERAKGEAS